MFRMTTETLLADILDHQLHQLGDELLRRLDRKYLGLRSHGLNDEGVSIVGQPDSYVGPSAESCTIAVCYTTQKSGWWNKVADDVREAMSVSPNVREVVVVLTRDVDREGPKARKNEPAIDWLAKVREAAGNAVLRIIDRKELAQYLDAEHQDLRLRFLGIPYSRLTPS